MSSKSRSLPFLFTVSAAIVVLAGCKPSPENEGQSENLSRDPSGLVIPVSLGNRNKPAANKIALLWLWAWGDTDADMTARYLVEP